MEWVKGGSTGDAPLTPPTNSIPDHIDIGKASLTELGELNFFFFNIPGAYLAQLCLPEAFQPS